MANSIHVMKMCQALAVRGDKVKLIGFTNLKKYVLDETFKYYGVKRIFSLKLFQNRNKFSKIFNISKILLVRGNKENIIYTRYSYAAFLAIIFRYRVIYESHGLPHNRIVNYIEQLILKYNKLLKFIVISKRLKGLYKIHVNDSHNYTVQHDAADKIILDKCPNYPWPGINSLQIGYIGHLYKGRGIEIIIKCAEKLHQFDFHIIGGDETSLKYWKDRINQNNIYLHGFIDPSLTPMVRDKCDILLMPYQKKLSIAESDINTSEWMSPMKLFEYMSSKKAIISSDLPVIKEILNESNSILVEYHNVEKWINAILELQNSNKRKLLAEKAYQDFITKYTWNIRAERIMRDIF